MNDQRLGDSLDDLVPLAMEGPAMRMDPAHAGPHPPDGSFSASRGCSGSCQSHRSGHSPKSKPASGRPSTALIVDDSAIDRRIASHLIERGEGLGGLQIAMACNGSEAMQWMDHQRPAVVLADLQMPDLDGLALVRLIRERHPEVPVILMTAHGSEEIAVQAIKAGAASYVPKKALARELVSTLRSILEISANEGRQHRLFTHLESRETRFCLENDADLHAPLIGVLQEDLRNMGAFDPTTRIQIGVAIQEALNNAMFHGNLEVSSDLRQNDERDFYALAESRRRLQPFAGRKIHLTARIERNSEALTCTYIIRDEGPGFDISRLDRPFEPEDLMRIGGRGLLLIRAFMDQVVYNDLGNQVTMSKRDDLPHDR